MKKFIKTTLIGVVAGGSLGYAYWYFIGCSSGSCAITSSPLNSSLYGMFMGGVLLSSGWPFSKTQKTNHE